MKARKYFIMRIENPDAVANQKPGSVWRNLVKEYPALSKQGTIMKIDFIEKYLEMGGHKVNKYSTTKGNSLLKERSEKMDKLGISRDGAMVFYDDSKISGAMEDLVRIEDKMNEIGFPVDRVTERLTVKNSNIARVYRTYFGGKYEDVVIGDLTAPADIKRFVIDAGLNGFSHYVILQTDNDGKPNFKPTVPGVMFMDILVAVNRYGTIIEEVMPIDFSTDDSVSIKEIRHSSPAYSKALVVDTNSGAHVYLKPVSSGPGIWTKDEFPGVDAAEPFIESSLGKFELV
ncbi:hypothetical protein [uncultured Sphaerochaeta sp.]|uniref:hypothetical protein n=1 Tax=uncultured Sphaerochaeta sp. TaxID=886478 RepID=UPI002633C8C2|nr:hypothetical protein [uncultured Sphaerochaeta sp.]